MVALGGALVAGIPSHFAAKELQVRISGGPIDTTLRRLEKQLADLQEQKRRTGEADQGWFNKQWIERLSKDGLLHWALEANEPMLKNRIAAVRARKESGLSDAIDFYIYLATFSIVYSQVVTIAGGAAYALARARQRRRRENAIIDVVNDLEQQLNKSNEEAAKHKEALKAAAEALKDLINGPNSGTTPNNESTVSALEKTEAALSGAKENLRRLVQLLDDVEKKRE